MHHLRQYALYCSDDDFSSAHQWDHLQRLRARQCDVCVQNRCLEQLEQDYYTSYIRNQSTRRKSVWCLCSELLSRTTRTRSSYIIHHTCSNTTASLTGRKAGWCLCFTDFVSNSLRNIHDNRCMHAAVWQHQLRYASQCGVCSKWLFYNWEGHVLLSHKESW